MSPAAYVYLMTDQAAYHTVLHCTVWYNKPTGICKLKDPGSIIHSLLTVSFSVQPESVCWVIYLEQTHIFMHIHIQSKSVARVVMLCLLDLLLLEMCVRLWCLVGVGANKLDSVCLPVWSQIGVRCWLWETMQITVCKKEDVSLFGCLLNFRACVEMRAIVRWWNK